MSYGQKGIISSENTFAARDPEPWSAGTPQAGSAHNWKRSKAWAYLSSTRFRSRQHWEDDRRPRTPLAADQIRLKNGKAERRKTKIKTNKTRQRKARAHPGLTALPLPRCSPHSAIWRAAHERHVYIYRVPMTRSPPAGGADGNEGQKQPEHLRWCGASRGKGRRGMAACGQKRDLVRQVRTCFFQVMTNNQLRMKNNWSS